MRHGIWLGFTLLLIGGCPREASKEYKGELVEDNLPPAPRIDQAFVTRVLGPKSTLAGDPLVDEIDPRPGVEAIVAVRVEKRFQLLVARGDGEILAKALLGGKILASANIQKIGPVRAMKLLPDGGKIYLLPLETLVHQRAVCGLLAFRYRDDTLLLVGEFASKCWRRLAGGDGSDPYAPLSIHRDGVRVMIQVEEDSGVERYTWDKSQQAFRPIKGPAGGR
jgi:hypothetical protein